MLGELVGSMPRMAAAIRSGVGPATLLALSAARHPERPAVIDEYGVITAAELHQRVEALAAALHARYGIGRGQRVAVLCRNHRGFIEAFLAIARLSASVVPLNTDFAGPQLRDVVARDNIVGIVYDAEFEPVIDGAGFTGVRVVADRDIDELVALRAPRVRRPARGSSIMVMTSGTTGTPKAAPRGMGRREFFSIAKSLRPSMVLAATEPIRLGGLVPRGGGPILVSPPLFHLFGLLMLFAGLGMSSPLILRRRFDAEQALADIAQHRAGMACWVPTMLKRIMDLPADTRRSYDTSSLRTVVSGAAPLPPALGTAFMDHFGDVLYNGYASTEVGMGSLATPADLRVAPGTVGRPPRGLVKIRILDESGRRQLPRGETGRLFIKNPLMFHGYSDGGHKEMIDGYMSSGDVGHVDEHGLLFIDGRDDDMILSGGENVFPQEVEELLVTHDAVADAGLVGVPDEDFGSRLAAFVVLKDGSSVTAEEVKAYVKANLARYKVPRDVTFVDALPRTSTGKLKRKALTALHDQPT